MKKKTLLLVVALVLGVLALAAGGVAGAWWMLRNTPNGAVPAEVAAPEPEPDTREYRYISLDKVIVMLRGENGATTLHYMAFDLVFKTPEENEKLAKQHLPLLKTVAVKAMSAYTFAEATRMTIDDFAAAINRAYDDSYAAHPGGKPFAEAMIAKLIVE